MTENIENKLFLVDAYALIFRAYYAFINNPRINSKKQNTSAIFGFTNSLYEILKKENPDYIAVVFDPPGGSFRNELYPEYKANRSATPEDIIFAVPHIKAILEAMKIPAIEVENYEADDTIGTLAKKAEKEGVNVFMMTPDKDFAQLVSDKIKMYKPARKKKPVEIVGKDEICQKYNIEDPKQFIDILALWGDSSDNVPGVDGIGEKTAAKLISRFGSIEKLSLNVSLLKGKQKENLIAAKELMKLSKKLVTISLDVPVDLELDKMKRQPADTSKLKAIYEELEFRNFINNYLQADATDSQKSTKSEENTDNKDIEGSASNIKTIEHNYQLVETDEEISKLIKELEQQTEYCFDVETTGLDYHLSELTGIAFSYEKHKAFYLALPDDFEQAKQIVMKFADIFTDKSKLKIGQNIKFDIQMLKNYDIEVSEPYFDTMIAHYLLHPEQRHNFDALAKNYLNYETVKIEELIGEKGKNQKSMRDVDNKLIAEYAGEDADITLQLKHLLSANLEKENLFDVFNTIEMPLIRVLADIEYNGVSLDSENLNLYSKKLQGKVQVIEKEIYSLAETEFNIASPKQLGEVLFDKMRIIANPKKTKTGQYATGESELLKLESKHEIISKVLEYRGLQKLISTYADALPKLVNAKTGKIHTSFNQAVATTGRLSSNNPNLQNIPIKTEEGRQIRKAFTASGDNHILIAADYSQIELRLMATMSKDENMIKAFQNNEDIHTATAAKIFKIDAEKVDKTMRNQAKSANFGIIYGISSFGLAQNTGLSRREAKAIIDNYFSSYPKVKTYMDSQIALAREKAYVSTLFGRKRYLKDINSRNSLVRSVAERNSINAPIQGTAADIIKLAMINIHNQLKNSNLKSRMILQVHDELVFDVCKNEMEKVKQIIKQEMENVTKLSVPLTVEIGEGNNWLEAH